LLVIFKAFAPFNGGVQYLGRENLKNAKKVIEEFEREYRRDMEDIVRQEHKEGTFRRGDLPGRFTARKLSGWLDKWYDQEY